MSCGATPTQVLERSQGRLEVELEVACLDRATARSQCEAAEATAAQLPRWEAATKRAEAGLEAAQSAVQSAQSAEIR